jgi:adenylate cyclase
MTTQDFKRKLTAIVSADVKGYSRLMGEDDEATVRTITAYREVITEVVQKHRGRVVDSPGDNILAEFASVIDAVSSAVEIQEELRVRNSELPEERKMEFRIGVNLGDVIHEGDRIYGDGVNVAARVESLAEAGGVCVSGTVFDQIESKLPLGYEYLGEQSVKNISKPVRIYKALMDPEAVGKVIGEQRAEPRRGQKTALVVLTALLLIVGGLLIWRTAFPPVQVASVEKMAFPLPDRPSIAVLPFDNLSKDPKQEYFSDGLTVEIITALSKIPHLFVIAKHSMFTYKGKPVNVKQVAEEMGVRYVLEGSVRTAEERVRVTARLIDALSGDNLWAERYDRTLKDIFALQDEITMNILTALQVKLTQGEKISVLLKSTDNIDAYQKYLKGRVHFLRFNPDDNVAARKLWEEAIALDPEFISAYVDLAWTYLIDIHLGLSKSPKESLGRATQIAQKAISLDENSPFALSLLCSISAVKGQFDEAIAYGEKAVAISPNDSLAIAFLGRALVSAGRYEEALSGFEKAIRLDPIPLDWYITRVGQCYLHMGRYEEALEEFKKVLHLSPKNMVNRILLAADYSLLGRKEDASAEVAEILRLNPKFSIEAVAKWPYKNKADLDFVISALRKAGLE